MLTISKYLNGGSPAKCKFCNQPFPMAANHISSWHGQDGYYYCEPDCERDALEAKAKRLRFLS
jgi:hypothetical protein